MRPGGAGGGDVEGDPLTDLDTLMRPRWVIREGDLRTAKEWLKGDPD